MSEKMKQPQSPLVCLGWSADMVDTVTADLLRAADECYSIPFDMGPEAAKKRVGRGDIRYAYAHAIRQAVNEGATHACEPTIARYKQFIADIKPMIVFMRNCIEQYEREEKEGL